MASVSETESLDFPSSEALVRLRILTEDALRRAEDTSEVGRHQALIALDGACEYALWLASHARGVTGNEKTTLTDLYSKLKQAFPEPEWKVRGWEGVSQMHQARNVAQHAGVAPEAAQLPGWADATRAFIDSLCVAAFRTPLSGISLCLAVRDPELRSEVRKSEELLGEDPVGSFVLAIAAFDQARQRWRSQQEVSVDGALRSLFGPLPVNEVEGLLEVQHFAGDVGEYAWLTRARWEYENADWSPPQQEARRALVFVSGWIVRWETFNLGYPVDQWHAYHDTIEPPHTGESKDCQIIGSEVELVPDIPGRTARSRIILRLANVPSRGRSPWGQVLHQALKDSESNAGLGRIFADIDWQANGVLLVQVPLEADARVVGDLIEWAIALAAERYAEQATRSAKQETERQELERALAQFVATTTDQDLGLFGQVSVVDAPSADTPRWVALIEICSETPFLEELAQTHRIFINKNAAFLKAEVHEQKLAFAIEELSVDLQDALATAIADSEDQARHVRSIRAAQAETFHAFQAAIQRRFSP